MATRYYTPGAASQSGNLKPMYLTSTISLNSRHGDGNYAQLRPESSQDMELRLLERRDLLLKSRIRWLRVLARALATLCSVATLIPLIMTVVKFLQTRNIQYNVNGAIRTAWAAETVTWYTYMYTAVAAVSFLLNFVVMVSYLRSVRSANKADQIATYWSWATIVSHVVIWAVAAGLYRYGREPVDGKSKDLWDWTCSHSAAELQQVLTSVNFAKYCKVQTSSYYAGIANASLGILTGVIMVCVLLRSKSKKIVKRATFGTRSDLEPLRS
ncbi:uncharacterized protein RCC_04533 [Ramularia collo-cygni]|uniref:MARVEL domain-containing protein n=1 Tax=Ramularia collo-cygni TaxID=112498 RepID=A0A2D3VAW1_9PEZI|nr:uncharacterized protein RCC_04533 [Ramularia collo-cygni]CZT18689.1 uncharacterized protein RCC_04533 [Ramularia collo-cygni]